MRVDIKEIKYNNNIINKAYYGSNLVFDSSLIYDLNQNVYVFDLSKVVGNLTLTLQNKNSGTITDWGDNTFNTSLTHTYSKQGIYVVKTRQKITLGGSGDTNTKNSLIKCTNMDYTNGLCNNQFYNCINLISAPVIPSNFTNCSGAFENCISLTTIPQANIDLMEAVKTGSNTICTAHTSCYKGCTNLIQPQTYATLSGLYPSWF